jgi:hypothetical protein
VAKRPPTPSSRAHEASVTAVPGPAHNRSCGVAYSPIRRRRRPSTPVPPNQATVSTGRGLVPEGAPPRSPQARTPALRPSVTGSSCHRSAPAATQLLALSRHSDTAPAPRLAPIYTRPPQLLPRLQHGSSTHTHTDQMHRGAIDV